MTGGAPTEEDEIWPTPAQREAAREQARALREQVAAGGLRFEAYLPPSLALWLLDRIERGDFVDPSEAAFVLIGEAEELEPHRDLRKQLLARTLARASEGEPVPAEEVMRTLEERASRPRPQPARWEKPARHG